MSTEANEALVRRLIVLSRSKLTSGIFCRAQAHQPQEGGPGGVGQPAGHAKPPP